MDKKMEKNKVKCKTYHKISLLVQFFESGT